MPSSTPNGLVLASTVLFVGLKDVFNFLKEPISILLSSASEFFTAILEEPVSAKTPMNIWSSHILLFLFTTILHITIVGIVLFNMDLWNLYSDYQELSIILFIIFLIIKLILIIYVFLNRKDASDIEKVSSPLVIKFFIYELLALTFGFISITLIIGLFILILKYISNNNVGGFMVYAAILFIVLTFIIVTAVLIYKLRSDSSKTDTQNLIINVLFYLPCFVRDTWEWMRKYLSGPSIISIGVIIMVIAISILRPIYNSISDKIDEKYLLTGPVYINNETIVEVPTVDMDTIIEKPDYNHSITCWFWITPRPNTNSAYNKYTNILNYGRRPLLQYNSELDSLRVLYRPTSANLEELYNTKFIPKQRWNQFVINSNGGTIDVFINGELVSSKQIIEDIDVPSNIVVGSEDGIDGGIRNVNYSTEVPNARGIRMSYFINSLIYRFE
jgi:hypothetical protein